MLQFSIIAIISMVTYSKLLPHLVHGHSWWHQNLRVHTAAREICCDHNSEFQHPTTRAVWSYHCQTYVHN